MAQFFCTNHKKVPAKFKCHNCKRPFCSDCVERIGMNFMCKGCLGRISENLEMKNELKKSSFLGSALHLVLSFIGAGALVFGIVCFATTVSYILAAKDPHAWVIFHDGVVLDGVFTIILNFVTSVILVFQGWGLVVRKRFFFWSGIGVAFAYLAFFFLSISGSLGVTISKSHPAALSAAYLVGALLALLIIIVNRRDFF